ncbi:MAG: hypothetical protein ACI9HE_003601 [Planctomycetota bacterium]|jgi:hypothetical protein
MSAKTMLWMALGAAALGGSAYYLDKNRAAATQPDETESLFPELNEQLNRVDQLSISTASGSLVFARTEDAWALPANAGFPADRSKVGKFLLALEASERVERKTAKPERYGQLGLDSEAADSPTIHVLAQTGADTVVDLWVGNKRSAGAGTAYYVRVDGEASSWVAGGELGASTTLTDWVDTDLVDLARERLQAVRIEHSDGEAVVAARAADAAAGDSMTLINLPQGKLLQNEWVTGRFDNALQKLTFVGVSPTSAEDFPTEAVVKTTFWTKHGLAVTLETATMESGEWLTRVSAAYDPTGVPTVGTAPEAEDETEGDAEEAPPTPESLQAEADVINAKVGTWLYHLPQHKAQALRPRMDELVKDPEPGEPIEALDGFGMPTELNSLLDRPQEPELEAPVEVPPPAEEESTEESEESEGAGNTEGAEGGGL